MGNSGSTATVPPISASRPQTLGMTGEEKTQKWTKAFAECKPTLVGLANADSEGEKLGARAWWVICMAVRCGGCTEAYKQVTHQNFQPHC